MQEANINLRQCLDKPRVLLSLTLANRIPDRNTEIGLARDEVFNGVPQTLPYGLLWENATAPVSVRTVVCGHTACCSPSCTCCCTLRRTAPVWACRVPNVTTAFSPCMVDPQVYVSLSRPPMAEARVDLLWDDVRDGNARISDGG